MFFTIKHIYLTLYIVYALRISPIYSVPACSHARARVRPPARVCLRVRAWACGRVGACVCGRAARRPCGRARPRVCVGVRVCRACFRWLRHFIRL